MSLFNALHDRASGVAEIQDRCLVFTNDVDGARIILPFSTLQLSLEGINSHHYYFFDSLKPEIRICIQDIRVLEELSKKGVSTVDTVLRKSQTRKRRRFLAVSSPWAISFGLLIAIPFFLSSIPAAWLGGLLSPSQEKVIGRWLFPVIRLQHSIEEGHSAGEKIKYLVDHLKAANPELKNLEFDVYVSTSREVNAFAAPGNIIVVNRGFIENAQSIEEIMGVLAHEAGHIVLKHTVKSLSGALGSIVGTMILGSIIGYDGSVVVAKATNFLSLKYSRDDEFAADQKGFIFFE